MCIKQNKALTIALSLLFAITFSHVLATTAVAQQKRIYVGCTSGLTGPAALQFLRAVKMFNGIVDDVNAAGGIKGRPLKLIVADDASEPSRAMGNLKKFKEQDKCVAVYAANTSTVNLAAKAWAEKNHIPVIGTGAAEELFRDKGKSWWFAPNMPTSLLLEAVCRRIKKLGLKKVGFEGTNLAWGTDALKTLKGILPKYGLDFAGSVLCESGSKDLTIQAKQLQDKGTQAIVQIEYAPEMCVWGRALKEIGWSPLMITSVMHHISDALKICSKELLEGMECVVWGDYSKPFVKEVWDKYQKYSGERLEAQDILMNWDGFQVLLEAIKISNDPDNPEAIRDALYKVENFQTALGRKGTIGYFEIGRNYLMRSPEDTVIQVVKSGKFEDVK